MVSYHELSYETSASRTRTGDRNVPAAFDRGGALEEVSAKSLLTRPTQEAVAPPRGLLLNPFRQRRWLLGKGLDGRCGHFPAALVLGKCIR